MVLPDRALAENSFEGTLEVTTNGVNGTGLESTLENTFGMDLMTTLTQSRRELQDWWLQPREATRAEYEVKRLHESVEEFRLGHLQPLITFFRVVAAGQGVSTPCRP